MGKLHLPTLTAVRPPSSSDARLPPPALLVMLRRLLLLGDGFTMALAGRCWNDIGLGDAGGEVAIVAVALNASRYFTPTTKAV